MVRIEEESEMLTRLHYAVGMFEELVAKGLEDIAEALRSLAKRKL